MHVAEQLKAKTAATQIELGRDIDLAISASFGVAQYCIGDREWSAVLHRADNALYAAKNRGEIALLYWLQPARAWKQVLMWIQLPTAISS